MNLGTIATGRTGSKPILTTTQIYARIYDETLYRQFREAISQLEASPVGDWPSVGLIQRELVGKSHPLMQIISIKTVDLGDAWHVRKVI